MPIPVRSQPLPPPPPDPDRGHLGVALIARDGRTLPLVGARLVGEARGGIARCTLEQRFENRFAEALHVTYRMPLPAGGAVGGYAFEIARAVIAGQVQPRAEARERFARAVAAGHTAGLLAQERADIFTQELGHIPPGAALVARIAIDQRLAWLGAGRGRGEWELRFPTVIGPRYLGAGDTAADARATAIELSEEPLAARLALELTIRDALAPGGRPSSPTHQLHADDGRVTLLGSGGAPLDRDLVVRWPVATPEVGLALDTACTDPGEAYGLLTITPPAPAPGAAVHARDLIVLLDTSGSMAGGPLDQAKQVIARVIESLDERDHLELIEFSTAPRRYRPDPVAATPAAKHDAIAWVRAREAAGGTEMNLGVLEALEGLRPGAQRQVIVVTDGYVGNEEKIVRVLHNSLPASCRLHVLGIGSAVNRSLAAALARAGRGVEVLAGLDEDPGPAAERLIARTRAPVLIDVELAGTALLAQAPERPPDVYEGAPLVVALALRPDGGELEVRARTAHEVWEQRVHVPGLRSGEGNPAIAALYGRERVADLEVRSTIGEPFESEIQRLGLLHQIATRLTSWVAVDERHTTLGPVRRATIPQLLPYGTSAASFGLRRPYVCEDRLTTRVQAIAYCDDDLEDSEPMPGDERGGYGDRGFRTVMGPPPPSMGPPPPSMGSPPPSMEPLPMAKSTIPGADPRIDARRRRRTLIISLIALLIPAVWLALLWWWFA